MILIPSTHQYGFVSKFYKKADWSECTTLLPNNWLAETPQPIAVMRLGRQSAERERISEINFERFLLFTDRLNYLQLEPAQ
ncbi:hypothetical protein H7T43_01320 [Peribacillus simplex]|nr:hypothetical protein [Peribacillus simplex]